MTWPTVPTSVFAHAGEERLVQARVVAELGVDDSTSRLPWRAATGCPSTRPGSPCPGTGLLDPRRADEDGAHRVAAELGEVQILLEGMQLATERVAPGDDVHQRQVVAVQHDEPRAGAEHGVRAPPARAAAGPAPRARCRARRSSQPAARVHQPAQFLEVGPRAHLAHLGAEPAQDVHVEREATLQRQDAEPRAAWGMLCPPAPGYQPRPASVWLGSSLRASSESLSRCPGPPTRPRRARGRRSASRRLDDRRGAYRGILGLEDPRSPRTPTRRRAA